jgi:flagellar biosynthetic protein FliR
MSIDTTTATMFVLLLCRTTAWTVALPVIGSRGVGTAGRFALSISLAIFLTGVAPRQTLPATTGTLLTAAVTEVLIGLILGWLVALAVAGLEATGALIDLYGGFAAAMVLDPVGGQSAAVFGRLYNVLLGLLIVVTPALHGLIRAFAYSTEAVPVGSAPSFAGEPWRLVASATSDILVAAIAIGAPVLGALLLAEAGLSLASRFVPQANVFFVGLPLKALVALGMTGASLTLAPLFFPRLIEIGNELGRRILG